ncbi:MAG: DUF1631 family protein [Gammaproteobacteria bacterium]|nr:MAG: DUF1631 family protein [Gammaproteobacteria bacterium]
MQVPINSPKKEASSLTGEQPVNKQRVLAHDAAEFERLLMATIGREPLPQNGQGTTANTKVLVTQLNQLQLKGIYPHSQKDSVLALLQANAPSAAHMSLRDRNIVQFLDQVFRALLTSVNLDPVIKALLHRVQTPITKLALLDHSFLDNPDHPGRLFVDDMCYHGIGWYDGIGKAGQRFMDSVCDALSQLDHRFDDKPAEFLTIYQDLADKLSKEKEQFRKLVERTVATEKGLQNVRKAEAEAIDLINRITAGKKLPPRITLLLQKDWYAVLKQILIHHGSDSDTWGRMKKLTTNVVWTVLPNETPAERQKAIAIIEKLPDFITGELESLQLPGISIQKIIDQLQWVHVQILKGEALEYLPVNPICSTSAEAGVDVDISQHVLNHARSIDIGQWFQFSQDGQIHQRIKLASKDNDQFLFVNRAGLKATDLSTEQVAYYLLNGSLKALENHRPFSKAYLQHTALLLRLYEELTERDAREAERERLRAEQEAAARAAAAEKARREAEETARREEAARLKAEEEARKAEERRHAENLAKERAELEAREAAYKEAINGMPLGTWVQFFQENGDTLDCNLALKMRSTNKFVFVNRAGIKVAEKKGDELLALMKDGKFAIVDHGSVADSAIQRLIGSLKRD